MEPKYELGQIVYLVYSYYAGNVRIAPGTVGRVFVIIPGNPCRYNVDFGNNQIGRDISEYSLAVKD